MARLRQYEIEILMARFNSLVKEHNDNIMTPNEVEAELDIRLHAELPPLEELEELKAKLKELNHDIKELETAIHQRAKLADLNSGNNNWYNLPTYRNNLRAIMLKELGFKEVNSPEVRYQILNADNNNLEAIMASMKDKFNL